jgi:membrane protein required for colicin V production
MTVVDIVFLALVALSVAWGFWRGLTRELVSMISWVIIVVLVVRFSAPLGHLLPFDAPEMAHRIAGAALIIVACVLASVIVGRLLRAAVAATHLAGADRVLGAVFGALRGTLVALLLAAVIVEAGFSEHRFWRESVSGPYLEKIWHAMAGTAPGRRAPLLTLSGD